MARNRDSKGRFESGSFMNAAYGKPLAGAAVAAGVAAAGAFLWSRRDQVSEAFSSGMDRLSELKAKRMDDTRSQEEISEEALTLKETGRKSKVPRNVAQQEIKAGMPTTS